MRKNDRYSQRAEARLELLPDPRYGNDFADDEYASSPADAEETTSASTEHYRPQRVAEPPASRRSRTAPIPTQDDSPGPAKYNRVEDGRAAFGADEDDQFLRVPRRVAVRRGRLPETVSGRIVFALSTLIALGAIAALAMGISNYLQHDDHFRLASTGAVQISGEQHVSRAQLLEIFSRDAGRNVFTIPLSDRRATLESIPWVEHATVMRLLPNRLRVSIVERKPVAFTRDGSNIGLVDANGVLMPMPQDAEPAAMSLPVVIGMSADLPLSTRAARMSIFNSFVADIDSAGPPLSRKLSEVDLTDPEDIKALVPEDGMDVLVHFGNANYLARFQSFEQHLPEWRTLYPHLASADMRYDHQVVLDMEAGTATPANPANTSSAAADQAPTPVAGPAPTAAPTAAPAVAVAKPAAAKQPSMLQSLMAKFTAHKNIPAAKPAMQKPAIQKPAAQQVAAQKPAAVLSKPSAAETASAADENFPAPMTTQGKPGKHSAAIPLMANNRQAAPPVMTTRVTAPPAHAANSAQKPVTDLPVRGTTARTNTGANKTTAQKLNAARSTKLTAAKPAPAKHTTARTSASKSAPRKTASRTTAKNVPAKNPAKKKTARPKKDDDAPMVLPSINQGSTRSHKFVPAPVTGASGLGSNGGGAL